MNDDEVKQILLKDLKFTENDVNKLEVLKKSLLEYNSKYNLISKSTEKSIWSRHILDSAQLIKYFSTKYEASLADFNEEHKATLEWLNKITDENYNFFG